MSYVNRLRLRELREAQGLSQEDLAQLAGLKSGTIYKLEAGVNRNPKIDTLIAVAQALGIDITELLNTE